MNQHRFLVRDVLSAIEQVAPPATAAEWDNVGLQLGDPQAPVSRVVTCLDCTMDVLDQAGRGALVVTHHPPLFRPVRSLSEATPIGRLFARAARDQIAIYAAHTNFDVCRYSMGRACCERLGLANIRRVSPVPRAGEDKIVVFVPHEHRTAVLEAMAEAGAGRIGDYVKCSFSTPGNGTFLGLENTRPSVGRTGVFETVEEVRLEMVCPRVLRNQVIAAMVEAHPYEEVAYDIVPLCDVTDFHQATWRGGWERALSLEEAAARVSSQISDGAPVRVAGNLEQTVQRVAITTGSGAHDLHRLEDVDLFITGDIDHHAVLEAKDRNLAVIAAGHYHTERWFSQQMARLLADRLPAVERLVVAADEAPPFAIGV